MEVSKGINPNCSETVIRIDEEYARSIPSDIMSKWWSFDEPTEGYSSMRPTPGTRCFYFYQTCGTELVEWLEEHKVLYDIEAPFGAARDEWEPLDKTEDEESSPRDGGGGEFYRRKPYAN